MWKLLFQRCAAATGLVGVTCRTRVWFKRCNFALCVFVYFFFTLYSKQINNYKLSFTCMWMCVFFVVHWQFFSFFSWSGPNPDPTEPVGSKNWFSTSVCVWVVCLCVLFQHNLFVGKLVPFNCSWDYFLLVSSFSNKDWTFKTTTLLYCLFFSVIRVCVFFYHFTNT